MDIWCIQETKLIEKDKTPHKQGYTVIRKDRKQAMRRESNRGGGLLMGIKEEIPYKVVQKEFGGPEDDITEGMTVEIPLRNNQKLRITNMYIPPIRRTEQEEERGRRGEVSTDLWLSERCDMLLGDLNGHSAMFNRDLENVGSRRGLDTQREREDRGLDCGERHGMSE